MTKSSVQKNKKIQLFNLTFEIVYILEFSHKTTSQLFVYD